jgi:hypothetical protein
VIVKLVLLHKNAYYIIWVSVIQNLRLFKYWSTVSVSQWRCCNCGCGRAMEKLMRHSWELGIPQLRFLDVIHDNKLHPYQYSQNAQLFPDDLPPWMQFANSYDINTLRMSSFYNKILCTDEACFMHESLFIIRNSQFCAWDNPHGHQFWFHIGICAGIIGDIVIGLYLLFDWSTIAWFSGNCSTGAPSSCASSCEGQVVVLAWWSSSTLCERCPTVVQCNISRQVDWMSRVNYKASFDGLFSVGTLEGAGFCSPSQYYLISHDKFSRSCIDGGCQHVEVYSRECHAAYCCLSWNG